MDNYSSTTAFDKHSNSSYRRYNFAYAGLFLIPIFSMWGNSLVCISVWVEVGLRKRFNYFLVSLAISDLLCAILVMPISAWKMIDKEYITTISHEWCLIWYGLDVFFTASTIIHLCTISIDRYNALKNPLKVHGHKRCRSLVVQLLCAWIIPFSIACPLFIFALELDKNEKNESFKGCGPQNAYFILIATIVTFFIPLGIMTTTYILTVRILYIQRQEAEANLYSNAVASLVLKPMLNAHRNNKSNRKNHENQSNESNSNSINNNETKSLSFKSIPENGDSKSNSYKEPSPEDQVEMKPLLSIKRKKYSPPKPLTENSVCLLLENNTNFIESPQRQVSFKDQEKQNSTFWFSSNHCIIHENPLARRVQQKSFRISVKHKNDAYSSFCTKKKETEKQLKQINRSKKAVQTLGILFLLFIICYLPFFVTYLVDYFFKLCSGSSVTDKLLNFLEWMGYSGSMFNPIVYHFFNPVFRHTYQRLMKCRCHRVYIRHASSSQK